MKLGPRISDTAATWLSAHFSSRNAGAEYILEAFPELYRRVLRDLDGRFTPGELSLMLDVMNGHMLTPQLAGQSLIISCVDSMDLDGTGEKWKIDPEGFTDSLQGLRPFELACLEIWARAFWESGKGELKNWVAQLV